MAATKFVAKDKNTFSVSIKVTIIALIDVILICKNQKNLKNQKYPPGGDLYKRSF